MISILPIGAIAAAQTVAEPAESAFKKNAMKVGLVALAMVAAWKMLK